jgi:hypothetical protein
MAPAALEEFGETLELPRALLNLEATYDDPPAEPDAPTVAALRGGVVVLLVAAFERFLRAVVGEHLERLGGDPRPIPFDDLPAKLRVESVFMGLSHAMSGPVYGEPGKKEDRLPEVLLTAERVHMGSLNIAAMVETRGNADSNQVRSMLKSAAIEDPFETIRPIFEVEWGGAVAERFVRDTLDFIVNRRHLVVHRADVLNITRIDLEDSLRFLRALAAAIEASLDGHVGGILTHGA